MTAVNMEKSDIVNFFISSSKSCLNHINKYEKSYWKAACGLSRLRVLGMYLQGKKMDIYF